MWDCLLNDHPDVLAGMLVMLVGAGLALVCHWRRVDSATECNLRSRASASIIDLGPLRGSSSRPPWRTPGQCAAVAIPGLLSV